MAKTRISAPETELEIKLLPDAADAERIWRLAAIRKRACGRRATRHLRTVYYDTPDWDLQKAGIALRLRSLGAGRFEQHLKTAGTTEGGLFRRQEWKSTLPDGNLDLSALDEAALDRIAPFRKALRPVFESDLKRTTLDLGDGKSLVELALDRGTIRAFRPEGVRETPLVEIEMERKAGSPAFIYEAALDLANALPLSLGWQSKAERGISLYRGLAPTSRAYGMPSFAATASLGEALAAILSAAMAHVLANQDALRRTDDPEAVHQMRVGCRRLRAALSLFRAEIPEAALLGDGFRNLGAALGTVRDLDVFAHQTLEAILGAAEIPADLRPILERAKNTLRLRRAEALEEARRTIGAPETAVALLRLGLRTALLHQAGEGSPAVPVATVARRLSARHLRKLKTMDASLVGLAPEHRHKIRIAAKKLRYVLEFLAPALPAKATAPAIRRLARLQDCLGPLNDIAAVPRMVSDLIPTLRDRDLAVGFATGWHSRDAARLVDEAEALWREIRAGRTPQRKPARARS